MGTMEWNEIAAWLFKGGGAAVALYVANEFKRMGDTLARMEITLAVSAEKLDGLEKRIDKLEEKRGENK